MEFKRMANNAGKAARDLFAYFVPFTGMDYRRAVSVERTMREKPDALPGEIKTNAGDWAVVAYNALWGAAALSPLVWYLYNNSY